MTAPTIGLQFNQLTGSGMGGEASSGNGQSSSGSGTEEAELHHSSARYREVSLEIDCCQAQLDPDALDGPLKDAQRDPEYPAARRDLQQKLRNFDQELNGK